MTGGARNQDGSRSIRVLVVTLSYPALENRVVDGKFVAAEVEAFARNGASVVVVTPHFPGAALVDSPLPNVKIVRRRYFWPESLQMLKVPGRPLYRSGLVATLFQTPLLAISMIIGVIRFSRQSEIIHAQWTVGALLALPARWLYGIPVVVTARGSDLRLLPRWLNRWVHRRVDAAIDCFGPIAWNQEYKRNFPSRFINLPLIAALDFSGASKQQIREKYDGDACEDQLRVVYIGRIDPIKVEHDKLPIFELLNAVALLNRRGIVISLRYVGGGSHDLIESLRREIAELGLEDQVTLVGPLPDVSNEVLYCDLGVGGVGLNGVAHDFIVGSKPQIIIGTAPTVDDVWVNQETALIIPPNNFDQLLACLEWSFTHRRELAEIGRQSNLKLNGLVVDKDRGGKLYLEAFLRVIEGKRQSGSCGSGS